MSSSSTARETMWRPFSGPAHASRRASHGCPISGDARSGIPAMGEDVVTSLARPGTKVIVSTEPKAHLGYLRAALGLGLDCLVDKPIVLPMGSNGRPAADPSGWCGSRAQGDLRSDWRPLCGRDAPPLQRSLRIDRPVCTARLPKPWHAGHLYWCRAPRGSVAQEDEILSREDHPYRYGYGMLCHSGYHYIDILSGLLGYNENHFGRRAVELDVHRASAADQVRQIGPDPVRRLRGDAPSAALFPAPPVRRILSRPEPQGISEAAKSSACFGWTFCRPACRFVIGGNCQPMFTTRTDGTGPRPSA